MKKKLGDEEFPGFFLVLWSRLQDNTSGKEEVSRMYEAIKIIVTVAFVVLVAYSIYKAVKNGKNK